MVNTRNIASKMKNTAYKLDIQKSSIAKSIYESNTYWRGEAQQAFISAYKELENVTEKGNNILSCIGNKLTNLQYSIEEAERDIQRKKREKLLSR